MCRQYRVSRSGYYAWRERKSSRHSQDDAALQGEIAGIFRACHGRYGSPRVHEELLDRGRRCGKKRVARLMRESGLRARVADLYRRQPGLKRFYRLGNQWRGQPLTGPDQVWVADITYLRAAGQRWYLAVVMDLYSRRLVGWALGRRRGQELTTRALKLAWRARRVRRGVIFHSDRGVEYLGTEHRQQLLDYGFTPSSNRVRHPEDNAHMESFHHTLKAELIHRRTFASYAALYRALNDYFEFYNRRRRHSGIAYCTPEEYERLSA